MAPIQEEATRPETRCMVHAQIAYHRPTGLSDDEFRAWLAGRAGSRMSLRLEPTGAQSDRGVVYVFVREPPQPSRAHDAIDALLGDMRMLGLEPAIVTSR